MDMHCSAKADDTSAGRERRETFYHTPSVNELEELLCHGRGNWFDRKDGSHRRLVEVR